MTEALYFAMGVIVGAAGVVFMGLVWFLRYVMRRTAASRAAAEVMRRATVRGQR